MCVKSSSGRKFVRTIPGKKRRHRLWRWRRWEWRRRHCGGGDGESCGCEYSFVGGGGGIGFGVGCIGSCCGYDCVVSSGVGDGGGGGEIGRGFDSGVDVCHLERIGQGRVKKSRES